MATEAQITANRANALDVAAHLSEPKTQTRSSGPTPEEGKAAVSENRISHGMTGRFRLLGL